MIYKNIQFKDVKNIMDKKSDYIILDVREEEEYITGHVDNSTLFPVGTITENSAEKVIPNKNTIVMIYCKTGKRSNEASQILSKFGYTNIYDIGGLSGWPYGLSYGI